MFDAQAHFNNAADLLAKKLPIRYAGYWLEGTEGEQGVHHDATVAIIAHRTGKRLFYTFISEETSDGRNFVSRVLKLELTSIIVREQNELMMRWDSDVNRRVYLHKKSAENAIQHLVPIVIVVFDRNAQNLPITTIWHPLTIPTIAALEIAKKGAAATVQASN